MVQRTTPTKIAVDLRVSDIDKLIDFIDRCDESETNDHAQTIRAVLDSARARLQGQIAQAMERAEKKAAREEAKEAQHARLMAAHRC